MNNTTKRKQVNAPIRVSKVDTKTNMVIATYSSISEAEEANYYGQTTLHHRFKKGKFDEDGFKWVLVDRTPLLTMSDDELVQLFVNYLSSVLMGEPAEAEIKAYEYLKSLDLISSNN